MSKRKHLSRLARVRIFDIGCGICCLCGLKIDAPKERFIIEHKKPLWLGGSDDETNMGPAHLRCAIEKTSEEAVVKAKSDRVRANHLGIRKPSTFPGSRNSRWKRKVSGEVVPREQR